MQNQHNGQNEIWLSGTVLGKDATSPNMHPLKFAWVKRRNEEILCDEHLDRQCINFTPTGQRWWRCLITAIMNYPFSSLKLQPNIYTSPQMLFFLFLFHTGNMKILWFEPRSAVCEGSHLFGHWTRNSDFNFCSKTWDTQTELIYDLTLLEPFLTTPDIPASHLDPENRSRQITCTVACK